MTLDCKQCGAFDEPKVKITSLHHTAYCGNCGAYIKHLPKNRADQDDMILYIGKYKGRTVSSLISMEEKKYLVWYKHNIKNIKDWQIKVINNHLYK